MTQPIAIVGLGYVGLPLALHAVESGLSVVGLDIDLHKVEKLNSGASYIGHIAAVRIEAALRTGRFKASADFSEIKNCSAAILCVPTPLSRNQEPDLSYVLRTGESIAPFLQRGALVVLESTTYPGTTDTELRLVLEKGSSLRAGDDFHLGYSPEREDPGRSDHRLADIPKVISGYTAKCLERVSELYSNLFKTLVPVSSCRAAEAVKLTENIFRAVNIAMVNELKVVYSAMSIDIWEVINAAKTKPFGYMPFYPGPGWGGHCIPIDPFYLTWKARQYGQHTRFIELAGQINTAMPQHVVRRTETALASIGKTLAQSRILLVGIAYKQDVDDDRESPSYVLWRELEDRGALVEYLDPHVPVIRPSREHSRYAGRISIAATAGELKRFDLILVATAHRSIDYGVLAATGKLVVDTRNVMRGLVPAALYFPA